MPAAASAGRAALGRAEVEAFTETVGRPLAEARGPFLEEGRRGDRAGPRVFLLHGSDREQGPVGARAGGFEMRTRIVILMCGVSVLPLQSFAPAVAMASP